MFGRDRAEMADEGWPQGAVLEALESKYGGVEKLGSDGPLRVYGVEDNGVNFVVAFMLSTPISDAIVEIGFLARFIGFPVTVERVQALNRNLHISVASLEQEELYLMAGLQVAGQYDVTQFMLILESWRRDLAVTLGNLNGDEMAFSTVFPAAKLAAAREFAANAAPAPETGETFKGLAKFMGAERAPARSFCDACDGRGKRGLIARMCPDCDGSGFA